MLFLSKYTFRYRMYVFCFRICTPLNPPYDISTRIRRTESPIEHQRGELHSNVKKMQEAIEAGGFVFEGEIGLWLTKG